MLVLREVVEEAVGDVTTPAPLETRDEDGDSLEDEEREGALASIV